MHVLQGQGGSGKSTFVKALMAYVRSQDLIALGCASTALAATVYDDFLTTHSLFGIPVLEEDEYENIDDVEIEVSPERKYLISQASLIVWDEAFSNHSSCLTLILKNYINTKAIKSLPKVLLLVGDNKQIAPVVQYGNKNQLIEASIISHASFPQFKISRFTSNLRLRCIDNDNFLLFRNYASMLLEIGTANHRCFAENVSPPELKTSEYKIQIQCLTATSNLSDALFFLHPSGSVDDRYFYTRCIIAGNIVYTT